MAPLFTEQERAAIDGLQRPPPVLEGRVAQVRPLDLVARDHQALALLAHLQAAADRWGSALEFELLRELRHPCSVKPRAVEVVQAPRTLQSLADSPFVFGLVVNAQPRAGVVVVERALATAYAVCQFGGQLDAAEVGLTRTPISRQTVIRFARRIVDGLVVQLAALGVTDASVVDLSDEELSPPRSAALFDAGVALTSAEREAHAFVAIETAVAEFSPPPTAPSEAPVVRSVMIPELQRAHIAVSSVLGRANVTMRRLLALKSGDVLVLDTPADSEVDVLVAGKPKFYGKPLINRGRLSLEITRQENG